MQQPDRFTLEEVRGTTECTSAIHRWLPLPADATPADPGLPPPLLMGPEAAPAFSAVYAATAVLTCLSGSHSALLLADASVTLESLPAPVAGRSGGPRRGCDHLFVAGCHLVPLADGRHTQHQ